jgi:hypothetical protein
MVGLSVVERIVGPPSLIALVQERPCPTAYPRRVGVPTKRPLFPVPPRP